MIENKKKTYTKVIIISICSIMISTIFAILITSNSQSYMSHWLNTIDNNITKVFPSVDTNLKSYKINGSNFIALNSDPQIYSELFAEEINDSIIIIKFNKPLLQDINISIYYAAENQNFCEQRTVYNTTQKGKYLTFIELLSMKYSKLRIDIGDQQNIQFDLDSIILINNMKFYKYLNPLFISIIILCYGFLFIIFIYIMRNYNMKNKYFNMLQISLIFSCFTWILFNLDYAYSISILKCVENIIFQTVIIFLILFEVNNIKTKYINKSRGVL